MAIKQPDVYEHNNPDYAIVDSDKVRGGGRVVPTLAALYLLASKVDQLKERVTKVYVTDQTKYYILTDITHVGDSAGWTIESSGGGGTVSADTIDTALADFTTTDPITDTDLIIGKGKKKWLFSTIKTALGSVFAAVSHTHAYSAITGLPSLFSGNYSDLIGKPTLFSGAYTDLTGKPTIPAAQVNSDWNASTGLAQILNKPTIPTQYADSDVRSSALTGVVTAGTLANVTATDTQLTAWGKFMKLFSSLKALAFKDTIDYTSSDITNKPTIPTTLPASDVYAWAKSATKPTYTYSEVGAEPAITKSTGLLSWTGSAWAWVTNYINSKAGIEALLTGVITTHSHTVDLSSVVPTTRTINGLDLSANRNLVESIGYAMSDATTGITAGVKVPTAAVPYNFTITGVRAQVAVAPVGSLKLTIDIKLNTVSIFTTKLTFDSTEKITETAAVPYVLTASTIAVLTSDSLELSITSVGETTAAQNLTLFLIGYKS